MRLILTEEVRAWIDPIQKRLQDQGFTLYICGGALRDALLGRPCKDLDLVTDAPTEVIRACVPRGLCVGAHFEVCLLRSKGLQAEIASFRQDGPYIDGRRPSFTRPATIEVDALRRDFTVNALYQVWPDGALVDLVGGKQDLENKILRAVGCPLDRFKEDALRCLRAVRFVSELGFTLEAETKRDLQKASPYLKGISAERQEVELSRLLRGKHVDAALRDIRETGLLLDVLPQPPAFIPQEPDIEDWGWAVWLHQAPLKAKQVLKFFRFSNERAYRISLAIRSAATIEALKREERLSLFQSSARELFQALVRHFYPEHACTIRQWEEKWQKMKQAPKVDGHLLLSLGFEAGPKFKRMLLEARLQQFEGHLHKEDELLAWLKKAGSSQEG